ncbi:hypothetical protein HHK36_003221 [Tetracentron sinense]|uniref:Uncharacterized protein n=1 Tax=Tetracentron sinense TaxID=13715 RepID=A0A835DNR1_TETSI|nr:hypothetical protein HHK36_003221 [Tetracentron sinense]
MVELLAQLDSARHARFQPFFTFFFGPCLDANFDDKSEKSDSFVVDIESFSHSTDKEITANSRITLQRSLSRKVPQRDAERRTSSTTITATDQRDTIAAADASPKAALSGACTPEKPVIVPLVVRTTEPFSPQGQHIAESRCSRRYGGGRRSPPCWAMDPRRILFFFATLSSMGTIILIYFTLSISKFNGDDNAHAQYR